MTVGRPGAELAPGSFRPSAPVQASLREDAEHFANDPANWPTYKGDIAHLCAKCDVYHLSKPEWLEPGLTHQDAALLASMGVAVPEKMGRHVTPSWVLHSNFGCCIGTIQKSATYKICGTLRSCCQICLRRSICFADHPAIGQNQEMNACSKRNVALSAPEIAGQLSTRQFTV